MRQLGSAGVASFTDFSCEYNQLVFLIRRIMGRINVGGPVKVIKVTPSGLGANVGLIDVQPLINQVDGFGTPISAGIIHNLIYFRLQSGNSAIVIDPQVGDIGFAVYSDRDMSVVKRTQAQANPGSKRRFDVADGVYFGGVLGGAASHFLEFDPVNGVRLSSTVKVQVDAPEVDLIANTQANITSPWINLSSWVGMLAPFAMGTVPQGWLACPAAQTLVSTTTYATLFNAIGYAWGGSGSSFGLPFFEPGYVPLPGVGIGSVNHGKVKDHTHPYNTYSAQPPQSGSATAVWAGLAIAQTGTPASPEGGADNLAAGRGVQWCVKY